MRALVLDAPAELARDLQLRCNESSDLKLMIAGRHNPLVANQGDAIFQSFCSRCKLDLSAIRALRRTILQFRPDVLHSFQPRSLAQAVLATTGLRQPPKILSFYGITRVPSWREPADWITYLSPKIALHACESNAVKRALMEGGVKESKCEVIYNCVEKIAHPKSRAEVLAQFNIPVDSFVVGTVATVRPIKGIDILLKALIECSDIPNLVTVIAGSVHDPRVSQLSQDPRIRNRIRWLGYVDRAASIMPGMDLFAMPSRKEGLCRALLEAMGQAVCPVVSDAGGMKELVRNNRDGIVFSSEDHLGLASAIRKLHSSPQLRDRYALSALGQVTTYCAPNVVGGRVVGMFERALAA